jgi:hypothetical protein
MSNDPLFCISQVIEVIGVHHHHAWLLLVEMGQALNLNLPNL